jgi:hypothetical protein
VSPDLEGRLERAGAALPEPDADATRRARARALAAVTRRRRRRLPFVAAAALLVGCALGVALGTVFVSSGGAARPALGFGFLPEAGWSVVQTGGSPSSEQVVQAIAANVRLSPEDDPDGLPYATLLSLPPRGVVVVAASSGRPAEQGRVPSTLHLPLRLRDAGPMAYGVQVRPGRPLGQYELRGILDGQEIVVNIYFGSERPSRATLAATQRQLDRLVVTAQAPVAGVVERALPLRRAGGGSARVIDRTMLCPTLTSGGVREIELSAYSGFRQGGRWHTLPFARVATGGVRSVANSLEDSLAWVAAGKYDHNANLTPSDGIVLTNATRFGTWALNRGMCRPARGSVPLSARGLRAVTPDPLGVRLDCTTPRQVLVRVRVVAHAAPTRYREQQFEKTRASLQQGFFAVRTQAGKQLAFASVFDSGKARLAVASNCEED